MKRRLDPKKVNSLRTLEKRRIRYRLSAMAADSALNMPMVSSECRICLWRLDSSTLS